MRSVGLSVAGAKDCESDLWQWLSAAPPLRGHVYFGSADRPGELGAGTDLVVALASNLVAGSLVAVLQTWLSERRKLKTVKATSITLTDSAGRRVTVTSDEPSATANVLKEFLAVPDAKSSGSSLEADLGETPDQAT